MMIQDLWQAIATQLPWWKVLAALGGSLLVTAIAFGVLVWIDHRQSNTSNTNE